MNKGLRISTQFTAFALILAIMAGCETRGESFEPADMHIPEQQEGEIWTPRNEPAFQITLPEEFELRRSTESADITTWINADASVYVEVQEVKITDYFPEYVEIEGEYNFKVLREFGKSVINILEESSDYISDYAVLHQSNYSDRKAVVFEMTTETAGSEMYYLVGIVHNGTHFYVSYIYCNSDERYYQQDRFKKMLRSFTLI